MERVPLQGRSWDESAQFSLLNCTTVARYLTFKNIFIMVWYNRIVYEYFWKH